MTSITLGALIDRLIITKLKNHYADTAEKRASTEKQVGLLCSEINDYLTAVAAGDISSLTFEQNKVYKQHTTEVGNPTPDMGFGELVTMLVEANHRMWKNQEITYDFAAVPDDKKVEIINRCCTLNIERNKFMDAIDAWFAKRMASVAEQSSCCRPSCGPEQSGCGCSE